MNQESITSQSTVAPANGNTESSKDFSFAAYMANWSPKDAPRRNAVVDGTVVLKDKDGFFVSIGMKADAFCPIDEAADIEVGQTLQFSVIQETEEEDCSVILSRSRLVRWLELQAARDSKTTVDALVTDVTRAKGAGIIATVNHVRGFIPRSELAFFGKLDSLMNTSIPVKVIEADPAKGRGGDLILSHKLAVEEEQERFIATLAEGSIVTGTVSHILDKGVGVLVSVGLVTGLVHRTEIGDLSVKKGDEVQVKIIKIDAANRKLSFSLKQVAQQKVMEGLRVGEIITGVVARFTDYGVFVNINEAVDGLLHISEIPGKKGVKETYTAGQAIQVKVLAVDAARNRVALSRRDLPKEA